MLKIPNGKKHLVWCRIAKTASKSTVATLSESRAYRYIKDSINNHVVYVPEKQVLTVLELEDLAKINININDCYIFTIVRNPYDRVLSGWNYHSSFHESKNTHISFLSRLKNPPQCPKDKNAKPDKYSSWIHFTKSMTESISYNGQMRANHIIKFENYESEFVDFCTQIGLNISSTHHFNVGIDCSDRNFSSEEIDEINKLFAEDFENFNYIKR